MSDGPATVIPDVLLERVRVWRTGFEFATGPNGGPTAARISLEQAATILEGFAALFAPPAAEGGANVRAVISVNWERGIVVPLPPLDVNGQWLIVMYPDDPFYVGGSAELLGWADEVAAAHLLHVDDRDAATDDCATMVDLYRTIAAVIDAWTAVHPAL